MGYQFGHGEESASGDGSGIQYRENCSGCCSGYGNLTQQWFGDGECDGGGSGRASGEGGGLASSAGTDYNYRGNGFGRHSGGATFGIRATPGDYVFTILGQIIVKRMYSDWFSTYRFTREQAEAELAVRIMKQ